MSDINITSTDILEFFKIENPTCVEALMQMRESFADKASDSDMARFLIARKFDVDAASKMMTAHLEWRAQNPEVLKADCSKSLSFKNTYCHGTDLEVKEDLHLPLISDHPN